MPKDFDADARKKWREMLRLKPDISPSQGETLANLCRNHSNLVAIRKAKAAAQKDGSFTAMVTAKNGSLVQNPLIKAESRLIVLENRMLGVLKLNDDRPGAPPTMRPAGFLGPEPAHGWAIELALCAPLERSPAETEADRRRQANEKLLAANDWRAYEQNYDGGKHGTGNE